MDLKASKVKCVFSDLDGTLVHFERHFGSQGGKVENVNKDAGTAEFVYKTQRRSCRLLPTSTMGPGVMSDETIDLIGKIRKYGVKFVYVTGARKSTFIQRLPMMAKVDAGLAETGGRFLIDECTKLDEEWTKIQEVTCGERSAHELPALQRPGDLWTWARVLSNHGYEIDTRSYYFCFRVDLNKQIEELKSEQKFQELIDSELPKSITVACNLGKWDFFPMTSGKGNAVKYFMQKYKLDSKECVAMFDDENDLSMGYAVGGQCYALGTTHPSVQAALDANPSWKKASGVGPIATENVLKEILERLQE